MSTLRSKGAVMLALQKVHSRSSSAAPALTIETINKSVIATEYAVRGAIVARAEALEDELRSKPGSLPFDEIVYCNIGNPQALGQKPITFFREVVALCDHSTLLERPDVETLFSPAAVARARHIVSSSPSRATGAYSHSQGLRVCREAVAAGIESRDGYPSDPEHIFLTNGASSAVSQVMQLLLSSPSDGVMCPIPQYPLYSATLTLLGGRLVKYYLDEAGGWGTTVKDLESALRQAEGEGTRVKALVVINPGNPTGQVLDAGQQREIVQFCCDHNIVLLADEVYQENVYAAHRRFTSFKRVAGDMGLPSSALPIISFHSTSKGFYGECGRRGGYMEVCGLPPDVRNQLYKVASIGLCSNVAGQVLMSCIMDPPEDGEAGKVFRAEREAILSSLGRRAKYMVARLNELEGVTCNPSEGAMYAFPRLHLPLKAEEAAAAAGVPLDTFYATQLLEESGIVVVPGTGFGQVAGTWHIRLTILPSEEVMPKIMERLAAFHRRFMDTYRG